MPQIVRFLMIAFSLSFILKVMCGIARNCVNILVLDMENCLEVGKCSWQLEYLPMLRELSIDVLKLGHVHNNILKKIRYDEFIENTFFTWKDHILWPYCN